MQNAERRRTYLSLDSLLRDWDRAKSIARRHERSIALQCPVHGSPTLQSAGHDSPTLIAPRRGIVLPPEWVGPSYRGRT
jgi:hypothetical protein